MASSTCEEIVKAGYWFCDSKYPVASINSLLFTHLFAAFADVNPDTYEATFPSPYEVQFETFTKTVQRRNHHVKTLLAIGGATSDPSTFASIASHPNTRKSFIASTITLARTNSFHGLSLNWQYPSTSHEMTNLGSLLHDWRQAVDAESKCSGKPPLLLAMTVYYSPDYKSLPYPIQAIANNLNWINVLAYDFCTPGTSRKVTGAPAALYNPKSNRSGDTGIQAWKNAGVPAKKLVFGLPFFGYAWRLANANNQGIGAPANGPGDGQANGVEIAPDGSILYNQIINFINSNQVTQDFDDHYVTDYCSTDKTWIGYDDTQSISAKVVYVKNKAGLLGYFAWHVGADEDWTLSRAASDAWDAE